jgi:hypothetical protein
MGIKSQELIDGCFAKAADDEPIFVLRAQDMLASHFVREWAFMAERHGASREKISEALACARAMEKWPNRRMPT